MKKRNCFHCNNKFNKIFLKQCSYCNELFCISHNAPDIHNCVNNYEYLENKKIEFLESQKKLIYQKNKIDKI